jgi:thiol-disulfide isomerase/thioredoxin
MTKLWHRLWTRRFLCFGAAAVVISMAVRIANASAEKIPGTDRVGKPLAIRFTAVDGRPVDLEKLRGKVVLVDFWATWCVPCVREVPRVKAVYEKLHGKGFEIVGISFDEKKGALQSFVEKEKITWPQYFDGKGWGNQFGAQFGIESIPTMWLLDKKGLLRHVDARHDLEAKVQKLLAE